MPEANSRFVYVTYIRTTPEALWEALTTPEFQKQYWLGVTFDTDWKPGSSWKMQYGDGKITDVGELVTFDRPKKIVLKWRNEFRPELKAEGEAICTMELEPQDGGAVKLTVTHAIAREESKLITAVSGGWPRILSNLKSLLETGSVVMG